MTKFLGRSALVLEGLGVVFLVMIAIAVFETCPLWREAEAASSLPEEPVRPVLQYGQEVVLDDEFYFNVKAVVINEHPREGLYVVRITDGPGAISTIDAWITVPRRVHTVILTEVTEGHFSWVADPPERETNE